MNVLLVTATARETVADYLSALILVYTILIFVYILVQLFFGFGGRVPYNRALNAVLEFLRQVCEPYLSIFRRVIPPIGPLDISPIVAILVLSIVGGLVVDRDPRVAVSEQRSVSLAALVAILVVALDQVTKALVRDQILRGERARPAPRRTARARRERRRRVRPARRQRRARRARRRRGGDRRCSSTSRAIAARR